METGLKSLLCDCVLAIFCPAMTVPANVTLSSDAVNVGVIVLAQCQPGTAFPDDGPHIGVIVLAQCQPGTAFPDDGPHIGVIVFAQCQPGTAFPDDGPHLGVIVLAQCQPGTAFPDDDLTKVLQCVDNSTANDVSWNDTLVDCQGSNM